MDSDGKESLQRRVNVTRVFPWDLGLLRASYERVRSESFGAADSGTKIFREHSWDLIEVRNFDQRQPTVF